MDNSGREGGNLGGFFVGGEAATDAGIHRIAKEYVDSKVSIFFHGCDNLVGVGGIGYVHADKVVVDYDIVVVDRYDGLKESETLDDFMAASFKRDVITAEWARDVKKAEYGKSGRHLSDSAGHDGRFTDSGIGGGH